MTQMKLDVLIKKLDEQALQTLEQAIGNTVARTHFNVEIEHWLLACIHGLNAPLSSVLDRFQVSVGSVEDALFQQLEQFKTGNGRTPGFSPNLVTLLQNSWLHSSLNFHSQSITVLHLLYALLRCSEDYSYSVKLPEGLAKIDIDALEHYIQQLNERNFSTEHVTKKTTSALEQFTTNMTALARANKIDPIIGRHSEIRQIIDILTRRKQNNPILTGEAGVGKTAVIEGLALRIAQKDVPPGLQNAAIHSLDLAALQAGAGVKGEFEKRLKSVIEAVQISNHPIILFIDEAHNLIGAGNQVGQGDAANLLKPALARGTLRTIAATTWSEYKKYFEKDSALTRRFQVVHIHEPSQKTAIHMMRGLISTLEKHHQVIILDEAVSTAVTLSNRYIPSRHLPDKAISLLDTAAARVHISQTATPSAIEDLTKQLEIIQSNIRYLNREQNYGTDHHEKLESLKKSLRITTMELAKLEKNWEKETLLIKKIAGIKKNLEEQMPAPESLQQQLKRLEKRLQKTQGEVPLMHDCVDAQIIANIVSDWTGIPVGRMLRDNIRNTLSLEKKLCARILGQSHAIQIIAKQLQITHANLHDPGKPRGVFLLVGSSGIGKTETAMTLADLLYGGAQNLTIMNMSEFKEAHKISMLTGSPAGYVGYGEGGVLTEAVRRNPYSVVLLDEMEKAHPSIQEAFYQVFDQGFMMDGEGRRIDFKNTLILMTSNVGTETIMELFKKHENKIENKDILDALQPALLRHFKPAFLGRVNTIAYCPLGKKALRTIAQQKLERIKERVYDQYHATLCFSRGVIDNIVKKCQTLDTGARHIDYLINQQILPNVAIHFLKALENNTNICSIKVKVGKSNQFCYQTQ